MGTWIEDNANKESTGEQEEGSVDSSAVPSMPVTPATGVKATMMQRDRIGNQ